MLLHKKRRKSKDPSFSWKTIKRNYGVYPRLGNDYCMKIAAVARARLLEKCTQKLSAHSNAKNKKKKLLYSPSISINCIIQESDVSLEKYFNN